ncbi:hypothetical protein AOLI_G00309750 [Acnodon oligacanthus]
MLVKNCSKRQASAEIICEEDEIQHLCVLTTVTEGVQCWSHSHFNLHPSLKAYRERRSCSLKYGASGPAGAPQSTADRGKNERKKEGQNY